MTNVDPVVLPVWFFGLMSFVLGTICGSFFNVCIYRVPAKKSIVWPGSHCYACGTYIRGYDNVPLLSYLWLRGNCRDCGTHFSSRYFFIELLCGFLFLAVFLHFGINWIVPFHWAFVSLLLIGTFTDIDHFIIPDGITKGGVLFALATALLLPRQAAIGQEYLLVRDFYYMLLHGAAHTLPAPSFLAVFGWALASAALGWLLLWGLGVVGSLLFRKEAMGAGDIKLFAFLGAYLGAISCVWILFLASFLGATIGLSLLLSHKLLGKDEFEEIEIRPQQALELEELTGQPHPQEETMPAAQPPTSEVLVLKIARRTSRQLHQLPFGPYIAVAAILVLFLLGPLNSFTRTALLLPEAQTDQTTEAVAALDSLTAK